MYQSIRWYLDNCISEKDHEIKDQVRRELKHYARLKLKDQISENFFGSLLDRALDRMRSRSDVDIPILFKVKVERVTIYDNPNHMPSGHRRWIDLEVTGVTNYNKSLYTVREDKSKGRYGTLSFREENPDMLWLGSAKYEVIAWVVA